MGAGGCQWGDGWRGVISGAIGNITRFATAKQLVGYSVLGAGCSEPNFPVLTQIMCYKEDGGDPDAISMAG